MKTIHPIPPRAFDYYGPLLERYARRLIKDEVVASILAKQVIADQYYIDGLMPSVNLRHILQFDIVSRCHCYLLALVFDHAPEKLYNIRKTRELFQTNKTKNQTPNCSAL